MPQSGIDPIVPIVIVGAGAAGLLAAISAATAATGTRVLLLERTRDGGRKILLSGGGRCNVLPSATDPSRFVTDSSPNTLRKLLLSWPLAEQRRFFEEEAGVPLALEPETGKLFPASNRARDVRDRLLALAASRGVEIRYGATVTDLEPPASSEAPWTIRLAPRDTPGESRGPANRLAPQQSRDPANRLAPREALQAAAVVLATGGLSMPGTGSDGTGLALARRLGHAVHDTYPALTPLTATGDSQAPHAALAGISAVVTLRAPLPPGHAGAAGIAHGGFLFTHRGYSGPVVLDLSHRAVRSRLAGGPRQPLLVQWTALDAAAWDDLLRTGGGTVASLLRRHLPERLATTLTAEAGIEPGRRTPQLRRDERRQLVESLIRYPLPWTGDEGYAKAEVTGGGVSLSEIDPRTLESRRHAGLFLCGEMLDAFGPIGGHNFQWAWATGRTAGLGAARKTRGPVE